MYLFVSSTCIFYVSFMYLLCISAVYLQKIISHFEDNGATYINTPTVALACTTGGPHRGGSSRRGTLRVWLRALRPQPVIVNHTQTTRIIQLTNAHQAPAHTCAPVVFVPRSPARTHGKHSKCKAHPPLAIWYLYCALQRARTIWGVQKHQRLTALISAMRHTKQ